MTTPAERNMITRIAVHIARKGAQEIRKIAANYRHDADALDDQDQAGEARFMRQVAAEHDALISAIENAAMTTEIRMVAVLETADREDAMEDES